MPPLLMAGFDRQHLPTRSLREAARQLGDADPLARLVSTGALRAWDLFALRASGLPGARQWADKTLDSLVAAAMDRYREQIECPDCVDLGFYGLVDAEDPDMLTGLLRREGDGGYEHLVAGGGWQPYTPVWDQKLEILDQEIAADLAEALVAGAQGLVRRYYWPKAFLPPETMISSADTRAILAAGAAPGAAKKPAGSSDTGKPDAKAQKTAEHAAAEASVTAGPEDGWTEYAVVDDLDPGAVLNLIRLAPGPQLVDYQKGAWVENPDLLSRLQGVNPPPLVELNQDQLTSVMQQMDNGTPGQAAPATPDDGAGTPNEDDAEDDDASATTAAGLPKKQKCKFCKEQATKRVIHSEGMAYVPACDKHLTDAKSAAASCTPDGSMDPSNIDAIRDIAATVASGLGALVAGDKVPLHESPDPRAEKLRRYWTTGKGGIKVRWGTKGDWTRCYRHLSKFMGLRAKGYCQELHKRSTGVYTGNKKNVGGNGQHQGVGHRLTAAGSPRTAVSVEAALLASVSTGAFFGPEGTGEGMTLKDGVYAEGGGDVALLRTLTAGGFPVAPPDEWFENPQLDGPTPLTVEDDGRVYGHIATFDVAHIGLPGRVHAPKNRSDYAYFKTGQLVTASGKKINVGQLTLAGGHAPLNADASAAVAHYDNTASGVADLNCGEDKHGIWVAGACRPEVTPQQLRTLRASAPSGDWRPINGRLELVACCQVNVPGFPVTRARVASGAITALVAAGARPLAARKLALMADAAVAERLTALENAIYGANETDLIEGDGTVPSELVADVESAFVTDGTEAPVAQGEDVEAPVAEATATEEVPVSDAVKRARELVAQRRADREATRAALRERVHGKPVAAAANPFDPDGDGDDDSIPGGPGDTDDDGGSGVPDSLGDAGDDYADAVPGANPEIVHGQLAAGQGLGGMSHSQMVKSFHGDYAGDAGAFSKDLAEGKVKKPKKDSKPKAGPGNA